jgi:hypothetical protein
MILNLARALCLPVVGFGFVGRQLGGVPEGKQDSEAGAVLSCVHQHGGVQQFAQALDDRQSDAFAVVEMGPMTWFL